MGRRAGFGWALGVMALTVTGCSGRDGTTASASPSPPPSAASEVATTTTLDLTAVSPDADDPYCRAMIGIEAMDNVQMGAVATALGTGSDGAADLDAAEGGLAAAAEAAPPELAAQWRLVAEVYARLFASYRAAGFDVSTLMSDPAAALVFEELNSARVVAAANDIERYTLTRCGRALGLGDPGEIDLDGSVAAAAPIDDEAATRLGRDLLTSLGIEATPEQQACLGRAIVDPAVVGEEMAAASSDDPLSARLARRCGVALDVNPG